MKQEGKGFKLPIDLWREAIRGLLLIVFNANASGAVNRLHIINIIKILPLRVEYLDSHAVSITVRF